MEGDFLQAIKFSVVVPTFQRRDIVVASLLALAFQEYWHGYEVIVVVDGSTDGTIQAVQKLDLKVPVKIVCQDNRGAAAARNEGAKIARGNILIFLDDDMRAHPHMLREHDRAHNMGADVVIGHMPLASDAPKNCITDAVAAWAAERLGRLSRPGAILTIHDFLTGQMSVKRDIFEKQHGFDTIFTHGGTFGGEDLDFGVRLFDSGYKIVFSREAISFQYYNVSPAQYLRQWRQAGKADVLFSRKHPSHSQALFKLHNSHYPVNRFLWRPLAELSWLSSPIRIALRQWALWMVSNGWQTQICSRVFFGVRSMEYWTGVREGGRMPVSNKLLILAYHSISELKGDRILQPYGIPPHIFSRQLDILLRFGFNFVSGEELVEFVRGRGLLPRRAVLITFDDCYRDFVESALPILRTRGIPAVVFPVSSFLGKSNFWDQKLGAKSLPLLSREELKFVEECGIEVGSHSRTHRMLSKLNRREQDDEISGSLSELEDSGVRRPRIFSYPYGDFTPGLFDLLRRAGIKAGLGLTFGAVARGHDPMRLCRVEVLRSDTGLRFIMKVVRAFLVSQRRAGHLRE